MRSVCNMGYVLPLKDEDIPIYNKGMVSLYAEKIKVYS